MSFGVLLVLCGVYGVRPDPALVLLPVWIVLLLCLALGVGLIAASLIVSYRDVQHILPILIPFMLYASPVAYDVSQIAPRYQAAFYLLNPLAALIGGFPVVGHGHGACRRCDTSPGPSRWRSASSCVGAAIFRRTERRFADVI